MNRRNFLLAALGGLSLSACSMLPADSAPVTDPLVEGVHGLSAELLAQLRQRSMLGTEPLLVTTFQELRYLTDTRGLGKVIAEQMTADIVRAGHKVADLRYTGSIVINGQAGETVLSRDVEKIATAHKAKVLITGTYVEMGAMVSVSARALSTSDGVVLASADFTLPAERVRRLLG